MTAALTPVPKIQFFANDGTPLVGGKLYSYAAGTTTPLATYVSYAGTTANTNPVILDSRGEADVWLDNALYKLALYDADNALIWTVDNISSVNSGIFTGPVSGTTGTFSGALTAASGTFSGNVSAGGNVSGVDGTFTGAVSGATGAFSGAISGTTGTFTGNIQSASQNGSCLAGLRNRLINGNFYADQRNDGASQTITAGAALAYTVDRFYAYCTGANVTGQRVAGTAPNAYLYRFTGAASTTKIGFAQRIENLNCQDLAGQTATLSIDLSNSLLTTVTWTAWYASTANTFGTLAAPTRTQIATGTFTVTSTLTRYNTNINIPSAATTCIEIELSVGAQISGTWNIGNWQLEVGPVATPFEQRPIGMELALCQWYLPAYAYNMSGTSCYEPIGVGQFDNATALFAYCKFPVTTRVPPTGITVSAAADFLVRYNNANNVVSAIVIATSSGINGALVNITTSGASLGACGIFYTKNTVGSLLFTGCEL
jgi:hypothetical protein